MLSKVKKAVHDARKVPAVLSLPSLNVRMYLKGSKKVTMRDIQRARKYAREYWPQLIREHYNDTGTLIGLPHRYLVPSAGKSEFLFDEQYYWDSYFMILSHTDPKDERLVEGMLDNLIYLFNRFGLIPNASRMYSTSRSQPPLLTTFIFHVYETFNKSDKWLKERIQVAEKEYSTVWTSPHHPQWRLVYKGLSRYYDINVLHDLAEAESGWDMTPRFQRKSLDYLPVDLNALLYKYEMDFARAAEILGDKKAVERWQRKASHRKDVMNELMWAKVRGFYFDYDFVKHEQGNFWSLAAYYPMWAGMVTEGQAARLVDNLKRFDRQGGLTTTMRPIIDMSIFGSLKTQWAYPNGWAPLHFFVVEGLRRYGYHETAKRIALKWIETNTAWHKRHGVFLEKYNVVHRTKPPVEGVYPSQVGFGWTNAVFEYFCREFIDNEPK